VRIGLHIANFTWPDGPPRLGPVLADIASAADGAGFERISVMDHLWQISVIGPPEQEMLEAYTALGFLAAHTRTAKLLTLVTVILLPATLLAGVMGMNFKVGLFEHAWLFWVVVGTMLLIAALVLSLARVRRWI